MKVPEKKGLSLATKPFEFKPVVVDLVLEGLKKLGIAEDDEAEIKLVKDLLKELADAPKDKPRSVELFKKFADLKICEVSETNVKLIIHEPLVNREVKDSIQHKKRNEGGNFNKGGQRGGYNNRGGRGAHQNTPENQFIRQKNNEEKQKLIKQALEMKEKLKTEKNPVQKIKFAINLISPDNFDRKFNELRIYMFKDFKTQEECWEDDIEYSEEEHKLKTDDQIEKVLLDTIVQNIFRKAQDEKQFIIVYGELCEKLIKLELDLKGEKKSKSNMSKSVFRKNLIEACQSCFMRFFEPEERQKLNDPEKSILFKDRLFGNIEFVGELFRRNILSENTLNGIFGQLTDEVCDFTIEGAIVLMNKIGFNFEESCKKKAEKNPTAENNFKIIMAKFEEIVAEYDGTITKIDGIFVKYDTGKKEVLTETQYMTFYKDTQKALDQWGQEGKCETLTDE